MNSFLIASNIIKRTLRNPKSILALIILPIIIIFIFVLVLNTEDKQIKIGFINLDHGFYSEKVKDYLETNNDVTEQSNKENDEIKLFIIIPQNFTTSIEVGERTNVSIEAENINEVGILKENINQFISSLYSMEESATNIAQTTNKDKETLVNDMIDKMYQGKLILETSIINGSHLNEMGPVIGFSLIFIMIFMFTTIGIILEDKRKKVLARMYVSAKEHEIIIGNILGSIVIGLLQILPISLVLAYSFEMKTFNEIFGLFIILFCFLIATIGIGIGISAMIKKDFNPTILIATIITPTSILGGAMIPSTMMPDIINKIGYVVPQKYVMISLEKVFNGASISTYFINLLIIILFGIILSIFGLKTLKPIDE